jgi:peptide/nickel transport system ATP-binding protein
MVFQDPYGSLDPRMTVARIVAEPLSAQAGTSRLEQRDRAAEVLAQVGLHPHDLDKYPHEFSGGQRQRIAMARALITRPTLITPVSCTDTKPNYPRSAPDARNPRRAMLQEDTRYA